MKINVKPEGRLGVYIPEKESLIKWVKEQKFEAIHNMIPNGGMAIGADHDPESVVNDIKNADRLGILTGSAAYVNFGHSLAIIRSEKLEMYDIGRITDDMLEVRQLSKTKQPK